MTTPQGGTPSWAQSVSAFTDAISQSAAYTTATQIQFPDTTQLSGVCSGLFSGSAFTGGLMANGDPSTQGPGGAVVSGSQVFADTLCGLAGGTGIDTTPQSIVAGATNVNDAINASPLAAGTIAMAPGGSSGNTALDAINGSQAFASNLFSLISGCGCSGSNDPTETTPTQIQSTAEQTTNAFNNSPILSGILGLGQANGSSGNIAVDMINGGSSVANSVSGIAGTSNDISGLLSIVSFIFNMPADIINAIEGAVTGVENTGTSILDQIVGDAGDAIQSAISTLTSWFGDLGGLLGNPSLGSTSTSTSTSTGGTPSGQSLQSLLNLVGTDTVITPAQLAAVAPGAGTNVLPTVSAWSMIQGNALWAYDGPGRAGGTTSGCIRTVRTGVITVFYCHGLDDLAPPLIGGPGPLDPMQTTMQIANQYGLDFTHFEFVNIPHPGIGIPMAPDHTTALNNFISAIQNIPGKFCIYAGSEGAWIASDIYDLLRYGKYYDQVSGAYITNTSLMSRNNDFLLGVVWGNMRRQAGTTFPGAPVLGATGYGCLDPVLSDTESDRWWEFTVDAGTYPAYGSMTGITFQYSDSIGDCPPPSSSVGSSIRSIVSQATQETSLGFGEILSLGGDLIGAAITPSSGAGQLWYNLSTATAPHAIAWNTVQPFLASGDTRTYAQIIFDGINNLSPQSSPPEGGVRHQICGVRQPVQPYQVVTASCYVEWINVYVPENYAAIILGVNAYDANGNYIPGPPGQPVSVVAEQAVITAPISQSSWQLLSADFVTPSNTASACIVFDVEPLAMVTGTVWFDVENATFEVSNLLDGSLIDSSTIQQLLASQVGGVQGEADLLTSIQNMLDGLASANSGTVITGATIAGMFSSAAQTANSAAQALSLSVASANTLGNLSNPIYTGFRQGAQVTTQFVSSTTTVAAGSSILGILNISPALSVGLIEFLANGSSSSSVYVNVYNINSSSGALSNLWSSADISASIPGSQSWIEVAIPTADIISATISELLAVEIANNGSNAIQVAAATTGLPNHPSIIPPNQGATRTLSGTGGATPSALTSAQVTYSNTIPCIALSSTAGAPATNPTSAQSFPSAGTYECGLPTWIADGDMVIIAMLPGGGGGTTGGFFGEGTGGGCGNWTTATLVYGDDIPGSTTTLTVTVGAGGTAGGGNGGESSVTGVGVATISTGPGGVGGASTTTTGLSPGNISYAGQPYFGGIASSATANAPGGGGGAGNAGFLGLGGTAAYAGADGEVWITVQQGSQLSSSTISYSAAGTYTYNIPVWANYLDFIVLSGGGSGATWDNVNSLPGGGGSPGVWSTQTIGAADFPSGAITVAVGAGGAQAVPSPGIAWQGTNTGCSNNSLAIPTHVPGDIIMMLAVDTTGSTIPTPPAAGGTVPAWVYQSGGQVGELAVWVGYYIATANNHTSGTWGSTQMMQITVLSGANPTTPVGAGNGTGGISGVATSPSITLQDNSGNSYIFDLYILNLGGSGAYSETWNPPPAGSTLLGSSVSAYGMLCANTVTNTAQSVMPALPQAITPAYNFSWVGIQGEVLCNYTPTYTATAGNPGGASSVSGSGMTTVTAAGGAGGSLDAAAAAAAAAGNKQYNNVTYAGTLPNSAVGGAGGTSTTNYHGNPGGDGEVWIVARS